MAEYNPSKIIKDGNTYNFRDTTKIPLAGSNAISGSLIPSTDGTVNLGGSSYQWNNAYIKSLTINGVACGDILTHNASEFVPRSGGAVVTGTMIGRADNTAGLDICGGTSFENGGFVALRGKDTDVPGQKGAVVIGTNNGSNNCNMLLKPDGTATWGNKEIETIEEQGTGYIRYTNGIQICWDKGEYDNGQVISYPKAFREYPSVVTSSTANATDWRDTNFTMTVYDGRTYACWYAIGMWK